MSISAETLSKIREQLKEAKPAGGSVPQDLYGHLSEVFNRILMHHKNDAFDKFEEISALVKRSHISFSDPKRDYEVNDSKSRKNETDTVTEAWITKSRNLLNEIQEGLTKSGHKFSMPNFADEAEMLEWAGVSFGEEDSYKLQKSMKRLAQLSGANGIRFAGKIFGTQKDYWIASGSLSTAEEFQIERTIERRGQGVNKLVFWATENLLSDWIQLPDCKPEHIKVARQIKHIMTGNLNASINSNPSFPGKERHYLRAQIARIFAATNIAPKGLFEISEETNEMKFTEEFTMPQTEDLRNLESWCNVEQSILKVGRTTHIASVGKTAEEAEEELNKLAEEDKAEERFRGINEHTPIVGMETAWTSKIVGDTQQYNLIPNAFRKQEGTTSYAVNVIKSLRWPGAVTVSKGGKFTNVYVGFGQKRVDPSFNPTEPPELMRDPVDSVEQPEPTPFNEPKVVEEKKEEGEEKPVDDEE